MARRWLVLFLIAALAAAGCGGSEPAAEPTAAAPTETEEPAAPTTAPPMEEATTESTTAATAATGAPTAASGEMTVAVASSELGDILVDGEGRTLYAFLNDAQGAPTCADDCAQNWPPVPGPATAGEGVDEALLATAERDDGSVQVTYNDWPLYHFAGDAAPGETNGQGIGEVWYVVDAAGEPVEAAGAEPAG